MRPPKIDFRFLFYTPKNIHLKYIYVFNANLLEKYLNMFFIVYLLLYKQINMRLNRSPLVRRCSENYGYCQWSKYTFSELLTHYL